MLQHDILFPDQLPAVDGLVCAMSTRHGGVSPEPLGMNLSFRVGDEQSRVEENRKRFFGRLGIDPERIATARQCHSASVAYAKDPGVYEAVDGLITDQPNVWLAISIADCVPVLVVDQRRRVIGAFHAGWRGTAAGMVAHGIEAMKKEFDARPEDMYGFIGPSARSCCYEVGAEVAEVFQNGVIERRDGKTWLDLKKANLRQLIDQGIPEHQIEASPSCTICTGDLYHSYRRERERSGRMMAVIGIRN